MEEMFQTEKGREVYGQGCSILGFYHLWQRDEASIKKKIFYAIMSESF